VRLLIASTAAKTAYTTQVAKQIVQLAQSDKTVVGVMGMPFSSRSVSAIQVLGQANIPMISQTSSSDLLTRSSPLTFSALPPLISHRVSQERTMQSRLCMLKQRRCFTILPILTARAWRAISLSNSRLMVIASRSKKTYTVGKPETLPARLQDALPHKP